MLNQEVFDTVRAANKKILVVSKYWDNTTTLEIFSQCQDLYPDIVLWLWENRTKTLQNKKLNRKNAHFIWNIQSRDIWNIVQYCSTIHSLDNLKHAEKIEKTAVKTEAFIQIKLDKNKKIGISEDEIQDFLDSCKQYISLKIIWFSWMWGWDMNEEEKRKEFRKLIKIRDHYLPKGLISAGTSRDYKIALEEWIDIVRVGKSIIN